jgi:hypothetical protein
MKRLVHTACLAAAIAVAVLPALAGTASAAPAATGLLRIAQLSPNSSPVDIYLDGTRVVAAAPFTTVAPYRSVAAGSHTLDVKAANGTATLATDTFTVASGQDRTALVLGLSGALLVNVITDQLITPPSGQAAVRLLHAAPDVPAVDVNEATTSTRLFSNVAYNAPTAYADIAGGSYSITMAQANTTQVLFVVHGVAVKAGSAYTLAAVGGAGHALQVLPLVDANSSGKAPVGGVQTGLGGTAGGGGMLAPIVVGTSILAAAAALGALGFEVRRRAAALAR